MHKKGRKKLLSVRVAESTAFQCSKVLDSYGDAYPISYYEDFRLERHEADVQVQSEVLHRLFFSFFIFAIHLRAGPSPQRQRHRCSTFFLHDPLLRSSPGRRRGLWRKAMLHRRLYRRQGPARRTVTKKKEEKKKPRSTSGWTQTRAPLNASSASYLSSLKSL